MNDFERKAITQELINKLQTVHEAIVDVATTTEKIATYAPTLATVIMLGLLAAQEPLAILHGSAKKAIAEFTPEPNPAFVN